MCVAPLTIWVGKGADARQMQTACHECWQCRSNAVKDWVGRNIAESKTAVASHAVTLTYGRDARYGSVDHERAVILTYSDVQKWLKRLRRHGFPVRYFITGEFGGLKGRAHWHVMLYWQDQVPQVQLNRRAVQNHWDHGWSFYTEPNYREIWYNCKYIQKDQGATDQRVQPRMSKDPPIGAFYFQRFAEHHVKQGVAPQSLEYSFPEVRRGANGTGEHFKFRLADRSAELFLEYFIASWRKLRGDEPWPKSQLVDDFEEWGRIINPETFDYRPEPRTVVSPPDAHRRIYRPMGDAWDIENDVEKEVMRNGTLEEIEEYRWQRLVREQDAWDRFEGRAPVKGSVTGDGPGEGRSRDKGNYGRGRQPDRPDQ